MTYINVPPYFINRPLCRWEVNFLGNGLFIMHNTVDGLRNFFRRKNIESDALFLELL